MRWRAFCFSPAGPAFYFGLTVGFSIVGRLLFGWLADRWSPRWLMACTGVLLAIGPATAEILIVRLGLRESWLLLFYAFPFGLGIIVGIPLAGRIYDRVGSYEPVLILCVATLLVSAILAACVRPDRYRAELEAEISHAGVAAG